MVERYAHFCTAISNLNQYIQKIETQKMQSYGLGGSCAQYLVAISTSADGLTMAELCRTCRKDKSAVSRTISQLQEKELAFKNNSAGGLYRSKICLTEKGEKAAAEVASAACKAVELAGKGLESEERDVFYKSLDLISDNLRKLSESGI